VENRNIEEFCGPTPKDFEPVEITNNEFIFENNPNFEKINLYDFFGRGATVNSFEECAHYVSGGWEPFKTTIFDILTPILYFFVITAVLFSIYKSKALNKSTIIYLVKKFKKSLSIENLKNIFRKKLNVNILISVFVLIQHFFIFDYVRKKSVQIPSFIDEYISLTSNVNFFTNFDFNAGSFLGGSYSVYLTSGPISAIGSVISWNLSSNFIISRISNYYWLILLQLVFSIVVFKIYKESYKMILIFNGLIILLVPWWEGSLYSLGEIGSMIILSNAIFLFNKKRKLSLVLFSVSIFFGKILSLLPFLGFYAVHFFRQVNKVKVFNDILYFCIPLSIWLILVQLNYSSGNLITYLSDQYLLITNHSSSGVGNIQSFNFLNLRENISISESTDWNIYDQIRLSALPVIFSILLFINKEKIDKKFGELSLPIICSIFFPYIWFWVFSSTKWIRYSQHFSIIIIISLFYFIFSNIEFRDRDYIIFIILFSFFINNTKELIILLIVGAIFLINNIDKYKSRFYLKLLVVLIITLDISIPYFQKDTPGNLKNVIEVCESSLIDEDCLEAYMRKLSR
jgi:hypothetical protein